MTIQAQLWDLLLVALIPTGGVLFAAGGLVSKFKGQGKELKQLREELDDLKGMRTDVARMDERLKAHTENTNAALVRIEKKLDRSSL